MGAEFFSNRRPRLWAGFLAALALGCSGATPDSPDEPVAKVDLMPCSYFAGAAPAPTPTTSTTARADHEDFGSHGGCAGWVDGDLRLEPEHLRALDFGESGLAEVWVDGSWYYVRPGGRAMSVLTFDNGPDLFSEGLARTRKDDKIAYFNEDFQVVVPPRFDFGWPFEEGIALVCSDCREEKDGEHTELVGGSWGYIDKSGREVVPVELPRDEAIELKPGG